MLDQWFNKQRTGPQGNKPEKKKEVGLCWTSGSQLVYKEVNEAF